jgi:hypothetical protein
LTMRIPNWDGRMVGSDGDQRSRCAYWGLDVVDGWIDGWLWHLANYMILGWHCICDSPRCCSNQSTTILSKRGKVLMVCFFLRTNSRVDGKIRNMTTLQLLPHCMVQCDGIWALLLLGIFSLFWNADCLGFWCS